MIDGWKRSTLWLFPQKVFFRHSLQLYNQVLSIVTKIHPSLRVVLTLAPGTEASIKGITILISVEILRWLVGQPSQPIGEIAIPIGQMPQ